MSVKAYLQISMVIKTENREAAAKVYTDYRSPFLETIPGALSKDLLIRDADVQVLHGFDSVAHAQAYLYLPSMCLLGYNHFGRAIRTLEFTALDRIVGKSGRDEFLRERRLKQPSK